MDAFRFARMPPVRFGVSVVETLPEVLEGLLLARPRRVLLITGAGTVERSGHLTALLEQYDGVERWICAGEPSPSEVDEAVSAHRERGIDAVVSVGGGSVVDFGKAVSAMLPSGRSVMDHLEGVGAGVEHPGEKLPFVAVPTTSGTGGETTKNAVLSEVGANGFKRSLRHDAFVPDAVIVDASLLVTAPSAITAACGMDAFTQLIESYLSTAASPLTDALAWSGIEVVARSLIPACEDRSQDPAVRLDLAYGSMLSGVTLANAGLGIVHGYAGPLGGLFPVPHGVVCGTLMGAANRFNWQAMVARAPSAPGVPKMIRLGRLLSGVEGRSDPYYGEAVGAVLEEWTERLAIPRLGAYGVTAEDASRVVAMTQNRNNPVALNEDEIAGLLLERI